jgi:hypothetical protein
MGGETQKAMGTKLIDCFVDHAFTGLLDYEGFEWKANEFGLSAAGLGSL